MKCSDTQRFTIRIAVALLCTALSFFSPAVYAQSDANPTDKSIGPDSFGPDNMTGQNNVTESLPPKTGENHVPPKPGTDNKPAASMDKIPAAIDAPLTHDNASAPPNP